MVTLRFRKEKARDNQEGIKLAIKELNNNCLIFNTFKFNFNSARNTLKRLEKKLSNQDFFLEEKRKKNEEMIKRIRIGLKAKDQHIVELDK